MATEKKGSGNAEPGPAVSQIIEAVEKSVEFSDWRKINASSYLSSLFVMVRDIARLAGNGNEWLLSYYDKEDDTFTTFSSFGSQMATKEQAFKKGKVLPALKTDAVKVEVLDSIKAAEEVRNSKYKGEEASSIIAILQPLAGEELYDGVTGAGNGSKEIKNKSPRPVWNLTYITTSYNILNVKIDAGTGKVLSDRMSGVMDFMQKDQKDK